MNNKEKIEDIEERVREEYLSRQIDNHAYVLRHFPLTYEQSERAFRNLSVYLFKNYVSK
jgi:hypothetical protein